MCERNLKIDKGKDEYDATRREKQIDEFVLQLMISRYFCFPNSFYCSQHPNVKENG